MQRAAFFILLLPVMLWAVSLQPRPAAAQFGSCTMCPTGPCPICAPPHPDAIQCPLCCPPPCQVNDAKEVSTIAKTLEEFKKTYETYQEIQEAMNFYKKIKGDDPQVNPAAVEPHLLPFYNRDESNAQYKDSFGNLMINPQDDPGRTIQDVKTHWFLNESDGPPTIDRQIQQSKMREFTYVASNVNLQTQASQARGLTQSGLGAVEAVQAEHERMSGKGNEVDIGHINAMFLRTMLASEIKALDLDITALETEARANLKEVTREDAVFEKINMQYEEYRDPVTETLAAATNKLDAFRNEVLGDAEKIIREIEKIHNDRVHVQSMLEEVKHLTAIINCHNQAMLDVKTVADRINGDRNLLFDPERWAALYYYDQSLNTPGLTISIDPLNYFSRGPIDPQNRPSKLVAGPSGVSANSSLAAFETALSRYENDRAPLSDYLRNLDPTTFMDSAECRREFSANRAAHAAVVKMMLGDTGALGYQSVCRPRSLWLRHPDNEQPQAQATAYCMSANYAKRYWDNSVFRVLLREGDEGAGEGGGIGPVPLWRELDQPYYARIQLLPKLPDQNSYSRGKTLCRWGKGLFEQWLKHDKYERMYREIRLRVGQLTPGQLQQLSRETGIPVEELDNAPVGVKAYIEMAYADLQDIRQYHVNKHGFDFLAADGLQKSFDVEDRLADELKRYLDSPAVQNGVGEMRQLEAADTSGQIFGGLGDRAANIVTIYRLFYERVKDVRNTIIPQACPSEYVTETGTPFTIPTEYNQQVPMRYCRIDHRNGQINTCTDCIYIDSNRSTQCMPK